MKRTERLRRPADPPIAISEEGGVRYLHFGSQWIQGAMRIRSPDRLELEYLQRMMAWLLFVEKPAQMLQVGIGAGSLIRFCHRRLPATSITAVEISARVLAVAAQSFGLPPESERLKLAIDDGAGWVARAANRGRYGVIAVDAFDAAARGPILDTKAFYADCRQALSATGILVVNLFGEERSLARNRARIKAAFDGRMIELAAPGRPNVIALAFSGPPLEISWRALRRRAAVLARDYGLPARPWVKALAALGGSDSPGFTV